MKVVIIEQVIGFLWELDINFFTNNFNAMSYILENKTNEYNNLSLCLSTDSLEY